MADRAFNSYPGAPSIAGDETLLIAQGGVTLNTTPNQILQAGLVPTFGDTTVRNLIFTANQSVSNVLAAPTATPGIPVWRQLSTDDIGGMGVFFSSPPPIGDVTPNTGAFTALSGLVTATGSPTSRTLADRAADLINAPDFGVKMDGTTSATAGLLASAAAANVLGGNVVHVPRGGIYAPGMTAPAEPTLWMADGTVLGTGTTPLALPGVVENWLSSDGAGRKRFSRTLGTSALDYATVEIARTLTHTGGAASSFSHNLVVSTTTNAAASNGEWNLLTRFSNNSPSVLGVSAYVYGEQNVAANAGTSQGLISFIANYTDNTGLPNPAAPSVTMELDQQVNGSDLTSVLPGTTSTGYRSFIHAAVVKWTGSALAPEVSRGLWFSGSDGGPGARLYSGVLFTDLDMNVAVDTSYATFSTGGPAIRLGAGQSLEFNGEVATRRLSYVTADAALEYKAGAQTPLKVLDAGGIAVAGSSTITASSPSLSALAITHAAGSSGTYTPRMSLSGSLFGSITGPATAAVASFTVNSDTLNASASGGITDLYIGHNIGSGAEGGRNGIFINIAQTAATNATGDYYVGIGSKVFGSFNAGGTSGTPDGNFFGANFRALLQTGATYIKSVIGMEADFGAQAGVTVAYKYGVTSVLEPTDAVDASVESAGFVFGLTKAASGPTASPGTKYGFVFANAESWWPINTTSGILIGASANPLAGGPSFACDYGIKLDNVTFATAFLKSTGFSVDGSGNQTAKNVINTGARADQSADVYIATVAGSRTIPNGCSWECLTPAGTIATFTTTMPAAPLDKQEVWISTTQTITTWTLNPNTGQTINGAPTTLGANTSVQFRYNLATTTWFRML